MRRGEERRGDGHADALISGIWSRVYGDNRLMIGFLISSIFARIRLSRRHISAHLVDALLRRGLVRLFAILLR